MSVTRKTVECREWWVLVCFPFLRVPEASGRKPEELPEALQTVFLFRRSSGSFRKLSGRVAGRLQGVLFLCGFRKLPEGFRKSYRKGNWHVVSQPDQRNPRNKQLVWSEWNCWSTQFLFWGSSPWLGCVTQLASVTNPVTTSVTRHFWSVTRRVTRPCNQLA